MMIPKKINDIWYAVDKKTKEIFKDMNQENLDFYDKESCENWCYSRNEIECIDMISGKVRSYYE